MSSSQFAKSRLSSSWLLALDSLAVVEEKLGRVDSWPSNALTDIFYKEPKVRVSRRDAAFLYGNGVSVRDAAKFHKASQAAWWYVSETQM